MIVLVTYKAHIESAKIDEIPVTLRNDENYEMLSTLYSGILYSDFFTFLNNSKGTGRHVRVVLLACMPIIIRMVLAMQMTAAGMATAGLQGVMAAYDMRNR